MTAYQRHKLREALEMKVATLWALLEVCPEEEDYVLEHVIKIEEELQCK
jgi:hypothetical protein